MSRRDALVAGALAAGLMILLMPVSRMGVDWLHDGIMVKPALDLLSGQVLFRDTFTQYGALTTYLQALVLWIQPSLLSMRLLAVAAHGVALYFFYAAWRQFLPRSLTVLACALFVLFIPIFEKDPWMNEFWLLLPWSSDFAMMFQAIALYALFQMIQGPSAARWALVLGAATAAVFWCRQPVGILMAGSLGITWLALGWTGWRPAGQPKRSVLLALLAGFMAVNLAILGGIALSGALPEWWYQNFVWPRKWSGTIGWLDTVRLFVNPLAGLGLAVLVLLFAVPGFVRRFRPGLSTRAWLVYFLVVTAGLAWQHARLIEVLEFGDGGWTALFPVLIAVQAGISIGLAFRRSSGPQSTEYYLVASSAALALGSLPQYYPMADSRHILWALAPGFGLIVFTLWRWLAQSPRVVALGLAVALLPAVYQKVQAARELFARPLVTLTEPAVLRGMRVPPAQARNLRRITDALDLILRARPDLPAALVGTDAMFLCFLTNLTNVSPYYVTWPNLIEPAENQRRWANIQRDRPLMFLHRAKWGAVDDFYRRERYLPVLYVEEEALEIAIPQELADAMGLKTYGLSATRTGPAAESPKP